jgi:hypothetical protein
MYACQFLINSEVSSGVVRQASQQRTVTGCCSERAQSAAAMSLSQAGLATCASVVCRQCMLNDPALPFIPSGLRDRA